LQKIHVDIAADMSLNVERFSDFLHVSRVSKVKSVKNQLLGNTGAVLALLIALTSPSFAVPPVDPPPVDPPVRGYVRPDVPALQTPEIDPGVARSAVTLLVGGLLILNDRRRRRSV
jgi:hypothetical protein